MEDPGRKCTLNLRRGSSIWAGRKALGMTAETNHYMDDGNKCERNYRTRKKTPEPEAYDLKKVL